MSYNDDPISSLNVSPPPDPRLAAALRYACQGWHVFPLYEVKPSGACSCPLGEKCNSRGKHPRTQRGLKEATSDATQIREWWQLWPDANVGVVTGPASGLLMIGPDGPQGIADLDALAAKHAGLPATARAMSGSGGQHHYFRWPQDGRKFGNRKNHRGTKIDVRGSGGYFVAPPSRNGNGTYQWIDEIDPADAPAWLLDWAFDTEPKGSPNPPPTPPAPAAAPNGVISDAYKRAGKYLAKLPPGVSGEGGHDKTFAAARAAVYGFDLGAARGFDLLASEFNPRCAPPWTEGELRHKCDDADTKPHDKPRGYLLGNESYSGKKLAPEPSQPAALTYSPFPIETLAPVLRDYVVEVAASVPADPAFAALPALTIAGAAAGAAIEISPKALFCEVPALWACTVGDSGTGKSPSARPTERLAFAIDSRMKVRHDSEMANYSRDMEAWNKNKESGGFPTSPKPVKPVREHFVVVDCTIERLAEVLEQSRRGVVMIRDELAGWFGAFTRYKSAGGTDVPNWLSLYEAGPLRVHRRTGEPRDIEVDRSFVAVCGGIQSGILRGVLSNPDYIASGLAARIVFAHPPKAVPQWSEAELSQAAVDRLAAALDALLRIPYDPLVGPAVVKLSAEAKHRFVIMNNEFAAAAEAEDGGPMAAFYAKATRIALRLALIDHCLRHADAGSDPTAASVSDISMEAGDCQARWFAHEAARVYSMCEDSGGAGHQRTLADWVRRKHPAGVTAREVQRSLSRYKTATAAQDALDGLVRDGLGSWEERTPGSMGGAPTRVFVFTDATPATGGGIPH